jgi:hypothetical protein
MEEGPAPARLTTRSLPHAGDTALSDIRRRLEGGDHGCAAVSPGPQQQHLIVMLQNFADELRQRVPLGK